MISNEEKYNWRYCQLGGMTRVEILSGEDISHLDELDKKKWTVLSCPVNGIHFDRETLNILDRNHDGHIQVDDVIEISRWLTSILSNPDLLFYGKSSVPISDINPGTEAGAQMLAAANTVFDITNKEDRSEISPDDVARAFALLQKETHTVLPYGDDTASAVESVNKLRAKIDDFFARCSLAAFQTDSATVLDVNPERIAAISEYNLSCCMDEVAKYPLARISMDGLLPLDGKINPAWQSEFALLKKRVFDKDFPGSKGISESQWKEVIARIEAYTDEKNCICPDDEAAILKLSDFLKLTEHFNRFLRNYVTFSDFYSKNEKFPAIFQAGRLYIDQRCCELCIEVTDMEAHNESAGLSGMYLLYCECKSLSADKTMTIVAAVTRGDVNNLRKGKNALFYDLEGNLYEATVIKIIDNPISIKQAFLSPYIKFFNWVTDKINKSAADKESKSFEELTKAGENIGKNITTRPDAQSVPSAKQAFDIAKFAGIFAALGMAVGYISSALVSLANGITAKWYNLPLMIIATVLVISGPSMFLAWSKLRKRNLGPLLNANGWAINAASIINVSFGTTLTSEARYPGLELVDPIAARQFKSDRKKRRIAIAAAILATAFAILYFTNALASLGLKF